MTRRRLFPTPAEVEAATPDSRDRAIDVIRIGALITVVVGHTVMATSTIRDDVFIWSNLLAAAPVFQILTWVFQIMPLFFFAGVAAAVPSWRPGASWGDWLLRRCTRLYRPVFAYLVFWAAALLVLRHLLPVHVYEPVAGISWQLLWFLGAYVLVLAAVPRLSRITTTGRLVAAVTVTYAAVAVVDAVRVSVPGWSALGYLNLAVWLIPGMLGVGYRRGLLSGPAAFGVGAAMLAANVALLRLGPYEVSLVGIEGQRLKNMTPPSLLLAGHAIMMCAFAIAAAPAIARWARRPRVWQVVAVGNSGAMTLYLWHIPPLLAMHLVFAYLGWSRFDPHAPGFAAASILQLAIMAVVVTVLFMAMRPVENTPLRCWDGGSVTGPGPRSAGVGVLLCVAGAATLASVGWGLRGAGLVFVAVMLTALCGARLLAGGTPAATASAAPAAPPAGHNSPRSCAAATTPPAAGS